MHRMPAVSDDRNPIIIAVGAFGNVTGTSSAGMALGTIFSPIPRNATVISARIILTPATTIAMPAANVIACTNAKTSGCWVTPERILHKGGTRLEGHHHEED